MNYTKKHKDLIAKLFKKVGMLKEAKIVLSCDEYKYDIGKAMRDAAGKMKTGIGANPALLDAARRYETRECAIFKECTLPHCEGGVWCDIYNLGGSHGCIGTAYRHLGKSAYDVPLSKRRKIMLEMLEYKTKNKPDKYNISVSMEQRRHK
ncbi:MAG: hypothetical protein KJ893_02050 [Candidatus Omnitrophica bacterium]|nr:hypothetical protein [Candidatus Omnitrophota bacterium]MBU4478406.1 hypothetical protein [Candidatus Omnitrophota bacterium]